MSGAVETAIGRAYEKLVVRAAAAVGVRVSPEVVADKNVLGASLTDSGPEELARLLLSGLVEVEDLDELLSRMAGRSKAALGVLGPSPNVGQVFFQMYSLASQYMALGLLYAIEVGREELAAPAFDEAAVERAAAALAEVPVDADLAIVARAMLAAAHRPAHGGFPGEMPS